jgi:hypothetical protein
MNVVYKEICGSCELLSGVEVLRKIIKHLLVLPISELRFKHPGSRTLDRDAQLNSRCVVLNTVNLMKMVRMIIGFRPLTPCVTSNNIGHLLCSVGLGLVRFYSKYTSWPFCFV